MRDEKKSELIEKYPLSRNDWERERLVSQLLRAKPDFLGNELQNRIPDNEDDSQRLRQAKSKLIELGYDKGAKDALIANQTSMNEIRNSRLNPSILPITIILLIALGVILSSR